MDWLRSSRYKREGIDVGGMTFEDNSEVVALIEATPNGLLPLLGEECFFPNASDASWLLKIKQAHKKHPCFSEDRQNKDAFTISHYPGKVTYESKGFLMKNKDPLSQDLTVLMQFSDDDFVKTLFEEKKGAGARRFKSAKFVGATDRRVSAPLARSVHVRRLTSFRRDLIDSFSIMYSLNEQLNRVI